MDRAVEEAISDTRRHNMVIANNAIVVGSCNGMVKDVKMDGTAWAMRIYPGWEVMEVNGVQITSQEHWHALERRYGVPEVEVVFRGPMAKGYEYIQAVKPLGVDWASGMKDRYTLAKRRLTKDAEVAKNPKAFAVPGVSYINIISAHAVGATRHGISTVGMPKVVLDGGRKIIKATTTARAKSGSATVDMALQQAVDLDPAYVAHVVPVMKWSMQVHSKTHRCTNMEQAWLDSRSDMSQVEDAEECVRCVKGPASAVMVTIRRLGWQETNSILWHTDAG